MTFAQYFTALRGKKIAVLGLGVSNRPLVRLLLEFGCDVTGCDRTPREKLDQEVLDLEASGAKLQILSDAIREAFDTEGWEDVRWERFFD